MQKKSQTQVVTWFSATRNLGMHLRSHTVKDPEIFYVFILYLIDFLLSNFIMHAFIIQ